MSKSKSPNLNELAPIYISIMEEVKRRVDIAEMLVRPAYELPLVVVYESCYLQLRKVCELIALACLVVHGEHEELRSAKLRKVYNAEELVSTLSRLHPDFYPLPGKQVVDQNTGSVVRIDPVEGDYLDKKELLALYRKAGGQMHAGSLRSILDQKKPGIQLEEIVTWISKIRNLLNHHQIQTVREGVQLWTIMHAEGTGKVLSWTFVRRAQAEDKAGLPNMI